MNLNDGSGNGFTHLKVQKNGGDLRAVESAMLKRMSKTEPKNDRHNFNGSNCLQDHPSLEVPNNKLRQAFFQQKLQNESVREALLNRLLEDEYETN